MPSILVVEDDPEIAAFVERGLREDGLATRVETDARAGMLAAAAERFDVVVFDRMLPGMDGADAVKLLRAAGVDSPVLILSAFGGIDQRVEGLEAGADDYLVKPFAYSELRARIFALMRRNPGIMKTTTLRVGDLILDRLSRSATREAVALELLPREFSILELLMSNVGEVMTRTMILEKVWGYRFDPKTSLVQTHVSRLRARVDRPFEKEMITTVRGSGYVLSKP
ncbi:MAG: response regulator transcription factor [Pseudomonadota bacterium]